MNGWKIKAYYSWFNSVIISREVLSRAENGVISERSISACPTIEGRDKKPKFLKITNAKMTDWRPLRIKYGSSFRLTLTPTDDLYSRKIRIVYFINCYFNVNYVFLFSSQMKSLLASGIMANPDTEAHIVFSGTEHDKQVLAAEVDKIFGFSQKFRFDHHVEKLYEYPGIRKIWHVARENSDAFIVYFHAKGITHLKLGRFRRNRLRLEKRLFQRVITEWKKNLLWLNHLPDSQKVGISCGGNGWIWYNFWWARCSHIACLEQPIITERRHYYEDWLGRFLSPTETNSHSGYVDTTKECVSIAWSEIMEKYNIGSVFDPGKGEVNLGLPFAWIRICLYKIRNLLK